jgi:hypothetical protein
MRGVIRNGLVVMAAMAATPALAGPFTVSSPGAATQKKIKIEAELKDTAGKDTLILPKLELTLPVTAGLNVAIKGHIRTVDKAGAPAETGFGDIEVKAKWNFLPAGEGRIAMAIEPVLSLPTGSHRRGLGDGHARIALPLILGYRTGAWELGGEVGYEHVFGSADHESYAGLLAMRRVTPNLRLGAELIVEAEDMDFHRLDTRASAGFKLRIGKNSELQGLAGRTLHTADQRTANRFKIAYEIKW